MRKLLLIAGVAALSLPGLALAGQLGYYDAAGVYHVGEPVTTPDGAYAAYSAPDNSDETSYTGGGLDARAAAVGQQIEDSGLSPDDMRQAYHDLRDIRRHEEDLASDHDGLSRDDRRDIWHRLNDLSNHISDEAGGD